MLTIRTQADFDAILVAPAASGTLAEKQIIRIYPTPTPYVVTAPIVITQSHIILQGYGKMLPHITYTGVNTSALSGILHFKGTTENVLENIIVENLNLDGVDKSKTNLCGIFATYCGLAQTTGLPDGGYDASTVGKDKPNKIGVTIRNCIAQGKGGHGIAINRSSNNAIMGNTMQNNGAAGISMTSSNNNTITSNTVQNNGVAGINMTSSNNNIITSNTVQNNGATGISVNLSNNNTITSNTVQNNRGDAGIALIASPNNTVIGNTVQNNLRIGIYVASATNNTITGNVIKGNTTIGINNLSAKNIIEANIIDHASGAHINSTGEYALILGNQMSSAGTGVTMSGTGAKQIDNIKG